MMQLQEIINEIDGVIKAAQGRGGLTPAEEDFFGQLKKRTETVYDFFKRMKKNVGNKK